MAPASCSSSPCPYRTPSVTHVFIRSLIYSLHKEALVFCKHWGTTLDKAQPFPQGL
jgi:hypothetical protein